MTTEGITEPLPEKLYYVQVASWKAKPANLWELMMPAFASIAYTCPIYAWKVAQTWLDSNATMLTWSHKPADYYSIITAHYGSPKLHDRKADGTRSSNSDENFETKCQEAFAILKGFFEHGNKYISTIKQAQSMYNSLVGWSSWVQQQMRLVKTDTLSVLPQSVRRAEMKWVQETRDRQRSSLKLLSTDCTPGWMSISDCFVINVGRLFDSGSLRRKGF